MNESLSVVDTLSSAILKIRLQSLFSGALDAAGTWALEIPGHTGFKLHCVLKGDGWVVLGRSKSRFFLRSGDCLLVMSGEPIVATSDLTFKRKTTLEQALKMVRNGAITLNGGGDFYTITVHFQFEGLLPNMIFGGLPPAIPVSGEDEGAEGLRSNIQRIRTEFLGKNAGRALMLSHLCPIVLVQILRVHLASGNAKPGWLASLADPRLSKAIDAIHLDCGKAWSLDRLATVAGLSRSGFAMTFKKNVGVTPGDYLTQWRMQSACELLCENQLGIAAIANKVGYGSESAFSAAFSKVVGCRPGAYRKPNSRNLRKPLSSKPASRVAS